jgi:hypothetical protein
MKKNFTTLLIVLGFYGMASAQMQKGDTEFGLEVGLNTAYVTESGTSQHTDAIAGLNAGVSGDFYFSDSWSLKIKALYDQKGWGNGFLTDNNGNEINGVDFKLNYITIPVMANWHFGRLRNWYLDFGPYVGILTSANAGGYDVKDSFNSTDVGLRLDIGVKFPISDKAKFFVEYGGAAGVTNIFKDTSDGSNITTATGSLNIGVNF